MSGPELYCDGSPGEVRAYQAGYQAGVHEGVLLGRQELAAEQLAAQRAEHERLGIDDLIQGHINYVREVPAWRRDELAGRVAKPELRAAA